MTSFNCECVDTNDNETLAEYRTRMLRRLGFATIAATPPPGMADMLTVFLQDAQRFLYLKYPALRTRRFFRWTMQEGERFYGLRENDENWSDEEVTVSVATPGVVTFAGDAPPNGREIYFTVEEGGALPTGITAFTRYFVVGNAGSTCNFAAEAGGTPIDTTGSTSGQITAHYSPADSCIFNFEPYKEIEGAWIVLENQQWLPLACGIPPSFYTTVMNPMYPTRYEIRQCIEVFPAPNASGYQLYIKGEFGMASFEEDTDKPTMDGQLVYLWALADALEYYGKPAYKSVRDQAADRLRDLVAGTHLTKRYIPGTRPLAPALMPIMAPGETPTS